MEEKNTLYINIFGGPGIGKSTAAAGLYWYMSRNYNDYSIELIREYAKELVWLEKFNILKNQVYVTSTQYYRMKMVEGKVDVAITDSPILLGLAYGEYPKEYTDLVVSLHKQFNSINIMLIRDRSNYDHLGRVEDENEARLKDKIIKNICVDNNIEFIEFSDTSELGLMKLSKFIINKYIE